MHRILIAENVDILPFVCSALEGFQIVACSLLSAAEEHLSSGHFDSIVIGIHFNDSRAIDLIKLIRSNPQNSHVPVIVHRMSSARHPELLKLTIDTMKSFHLVDTYLELENDPEAHKKLRDAVKEHLFNTR